ncbi:DMT family transporter [Corynebacterium macginleyi]|uniref:DMT family transporter n=1 Tax=Corynebacterium macginleyi TaxID=38290 RepID=UPI001F3B3AB4|nr:DMT family transporter [Corynebacterium macginleyi]
MGILAGLVLRIAGQVLIGLRVDYVGLFESPQSSLAELRCAGVLIVLAFTAGQSSINGRLGQVPEYPVSAALIPQIGAGLTVIAGPFGSLLGSLIIDHVNGEPINSRQILGIIFLGAGVALSRLV